MSMTELPNIKRTRKVAVPVESDGPTYLSRLLTHRRAELGMSQSQLADAINRSQPFVHGVESGRVWNISWMDIDALSRALQIGLDAITHTLAATYGALRGDVAAQLPDAESGQVMLVKDGDLVVRPRAPELRGTTKAQRAVGTVGEFSTSDVMAPKLRYSGVQLQPIHLDDIPMATDDPVES